MSDVRAYTRQFIEEIIELLKGFPCLWKIKSKEYSDRLAREKAFEELVQKFKEVEPSATKDTVQKKISSLRNSWRKELKKVKASRKSGAGEEDVYKPHLWYFELLLFLEDQETPRQSVSSIAGEYEEDASSESNVDVEVLSPTTPRPTSANPSTSSVKSGGKLSRANKKQILNDTDDLLNVIKKRFTGSPSQTGWYENLGKHWSHKMNSLSDDQRIFAEKLINDVFFEAEWGRLAHGCHVVPAGQYATTNPGNAYFTTSPQTYPMQHSQIQFQSHHIPRPQSQVPQASQGFQVSESRQPTCYPSTSQSEVTGLGDFATFSCL